jgi:hypothetical protein
MSYPHARGIFQNLHMRPSYSAFIARFVTVCWSFNQGLMVLRVAGMRETAIAGGLGVSAEIL